MEQPRMRFSQIEPDTFPIFPVSNTWKSLIVAKYGEGGREDKKMKKIPPDFGRFTYVIL